jgi:hypothetical protein
MPEITVYGNLNASSSNPAAPRGALSLLRELSRTQPSRTRAIKAVQPRVARTVDLAERARLTRLQAIDGEVKAHEAAHLAAMGGNAAGPVQYDYVMGPDGNLYAVGGSIPVNLQAVPGDPEATLRKAETIINAAFAPGDPSGADMQVAAQAYQLAMDAKREIAREQKRQESGGQQTDLFA